jgi:voltage-gated potassium channel
MFALAFGYLLLWAGLIHRTTTPTVTSLELFLIYSCLVLLWPVFAAEVLLSWRHRHPTCPRRPLLWRCLLVLILPPWRMGWIDPRFGLIWLPRRGWCAPGMALFKSLEQAFAVPMVVFASLILPLLLLEYLKAEQVQTNPLLALGLDISIAVIWIAFATEFILKSSAHPRPLRFIKDQWVDLAIVVLPMLEFLLTKWANATPLARLVQLGRALNPEQIARMKQVYRLRGLLTKAFHALLLWEGVARLLGQTPEKRLAKIQQRIHELQEQIAELQQEATQWQAKIDQAAHRSDSKDPQTHPPQATGERSAQ